MTTKRTLQDLAMMLRQFGRLQISRLLGTVKSTDGYYKAWIDLLERSYFMRAELNAMTKLLVDKNIVTREELQKRMTEEYAWYSAELASDWPEVEVTPSGFTVKDVSAFARRSKEERWPP